MWISIEQFSELAGLKYRRAAAVVTRSRCSGKKWRGALLTVRIVRGRGGAGGDRCEVLVSSLPAQLQHRLRRGRWSDAERTDRHKAFAALPTGVQQRAKRALAVVRAFAGLERSGASARRRRQEVAQRFGLSPTTVRNHVARCHGLHPGDWHVALASAPKGEPPRADMTDECYEWIKSEFFQLTKPALKPIFRRAQRLAAERGWILPSYKTVKRRIDAEPQWLHVLKRGGEDGLERMFPTVERTYGELPLHAVWCGDGHRADCWVRLEDGTICRPIIVSFLELRSRVSLGHCISPTESAEAARYALRASIERAGALPEQLQLDNGMAFAARLLTGGVPTRYRGKVTEDELPGIAPLLGIEVDWAPPGRGRAKPIESWHRLLAEMARRFPGAYVGHKPGARPEDCDPAKAVPIAEFRAVLEETLRDYHDKPHRGDAMTGATPNAIYERLVSRPDAILRRPTKEQLRLCMLAAVKIKLDPRDHAVRINGNRYWSPTLAALNPRVSYAVRYNPENAEDPIAVCLGDKVLCEARLVARTGFRDQPAAKAHALAKRQWTKSVNEQAAARVQMRKHRAWPAGVQPEPGRAPPVNATPLPSSKVVQMLNHPINPAVFDRPAEDEKVKRRREEREEFEQAIAIAMERERKSRIG